MKILVNLPSGFHSLQELAPVWSRLRALGEVRFASHDDANAFIGDLPDAEAILMWSWPAWTDELLDAAPNLKFAGHIDITQSGARALLKRGVAASVSRHGFSPAVAEMALALILSTLRGISNYHTRMRNGDEFWVENFPTDIPVCERELSGRPVGVIGFGRVGQRLAELLAPFGCQLRACDPFVPDAVLASHNATRTSLADTLSTSDIVVLCAATNDGTRHLIGAEEIELLRSDAVFVNVARAALVDTAALIRRLERGDLLVALDVFDDEPLEKHSKLRGLGNAYLTPHRAGGTRASVSRTLEYLTDDLEAMIKDRPRRHALSEKMISALDS